MFKSDLLSARYVKAVSCLLLLLTGNWQVVSAADAIKPFVLAAVHQGSDISEVVSSTRDALTNSDFEIVGQYSPYADSVVLAFTSAQLRENSTGSMRGGYGAAMRASVTLNGERIELAFTNPVYWANAYRMDNDLAATRARLDEALGFVEEFGTGEAELFASDMRKYHYTFMMEYFDDPSILAHFDSHQQAVQGINENLQSQVAAAKKVYQLDLGNDSEGKPMTLIGVGLGGENEDDCSSDAYIMQRIDKSSPRHTAHLPYEILVYGNHAEALFGRFRIAISWPHLPMMASETGATFFSIMCAPGAIEDSLTRVAGGSLTVKTSDDR